MLNKFFNETVLTFHNYNKRDETGNGMCLDYCKFLELIFRCLIADFEKIYKNAYECESRIADFKNQPTH